jgi:predicted nucleic acid-binding protein
VIESVTCQEILDEFEEKLRVKLGYAPERARTAVDEVRDFSRLVAITNTLRVVPADPDDNKVVECAIVGNATHIVTGDRRHLLPMCSYQNIEIVTASDFLASVSAA